MFITYKINDHIYQIKDPMGVLTTLIIGETSAILIDTGYGIFNLKEYVRKITDKKLIVMNSHGHMDHSCGNYLFDEVYLNHLDNDLVKKHNSLEWRKRNIQTARRMNLIDESYDVNEYLSKNEGNIKDLKIGSVFNIGNLNIEIIDLRGHTTGSVGFLIKEDRILVTSDGICPFVWIFLEESTTFKVYKEMLKETLNLEFDHFLVGHGAGKLLPRSRMEEFYQTALDLTIEKSVKVEFNNFDNANSYCFTLGKMYDQDDSGIVFDPNRME